MLQVAPNPSDFIPLFGMLTGIVVMGLLTLGVVKVFNGPVGQALARRIRGQHGDDSALAGEIADLREQVASLEHRLGESEERLDFTERLLTRQSGGDALPRE